LIEKKYLTFPEPPKINMATPGSQIRLDRLVALCKGDTARQLRYLHQFMELIPAGLEQLRQCLVLEDRSGIRQAVHYIGPQLIFFGLTGFSSLMEKIEKEATDLPWPDLARSIQACVPEIEGAIAELEDLIKTHPNTKDP